MAHRTIVLKGTPERHEYKSGGTISPGMLVRLQSDNTVIANPWAGETIPARVALENDLEGDAVGDAYAADERVQTGVFRKGEEFAGLLATSQTIVIGDHLEPAVGGYLQKHTQVTGTPDSATLFEAKEAVTTTSAAALIRCEVI